MHFFTPSTSWASVQMIILGVAGGMLNLSHNNYVLQKRTIINSANSVFIEIERKHMGEFHHKEMGYFCQTRKNSTGTNAVQHMKKLVPILIPPNIHQQRAMHYKSNTTPRLHSIQIEFGHHRDLDILELIPPPIQ